MGHLCFSFMIGTNLLLLLFTLSFAVDSISPSQSIRDGTTLVSKGGSFELGFFSPGSSENRYLGIWYKNIPVRTVVWVANRCNPINDSSGILMINSTGHLVLLGQNKSVVWWISSAKHAPSATVELLDSGNLVLRDAGTYLWQSFDYPSDTFLPGMKIGWDLRTGIKRSLSAWKNSEDPCPGDFTYGIEMERDTYPEAYVRKGTAKYYRTGPWNGLRFSGSPELRPNPLYSFNFVNNDDEVYYMYNLQNKSVISRIVLNQTTSTRDRFTWIEADQTWRAYSSVPRDLCDNYGLCGANGKCIIDENPVCQCLKGFKPMSQEKWNSMDWSLGCVRNKPLSCQERHKDGFVKFVALKLPDTTHSWLNKSMNLKECRTKCLNNCSCMAYTSSDIRGGGTGCAIWFGDLKDIRQFPAAGQVQYIRMSASELESGGKVKTAMIIAVSVAVVFSVVLLVGYYLHRNRRKLKEIGEANMNIEGEPEEDLELPLFDLPTVASATDNFSSDNKLGEGGFGPVYRGTLPDGQEIAVKRLSRSSGQGLNEFKNEIILFAKLQHRNLVKLLGCCIQGEEKMLIYEYMPNRSLDSFIFDSVRGELLLDWPKRFHIICGVARGLLYLHQDSRLRIVHRDLKASNVLLDNEMNPKISDFGLARTLVGGDQTGGNTNRVVGTYGYMAPEYAIYGLFSVKSDVFSFGILVLEVISGRKNKGFYHPNHSHNLIGHAWILWNQGRPLELIDTHLGSSYTLSEVLRCIHVSLLCVQHHPEDRPTMASVLIMLGSEIPLAQPKQPSFFIETESQKAGVSPGNEMKFFHMWKKIHAEFCEKIPESPCTEMALSSRWKLLNKEMAKWRDALANAMNLYRSGENRTNELIQAQMWFGATGGGKKSFTHHECWEVVKYCKRFIIIHTGPNVVLNETPLRYSTTSDSPLDSPMSEDSPIQKEPRHIGRKAAEAKKASNSSNHNSKFLEKIARQNAIRIEMEQKRQDMEVAIQAECAQEKEYLRKKDMEKTDRETMTMDTSHISPETKQYWKLE